MTSGERDERRLHFGLTLSEARSAGSKEADNNSSHHSIAKHSRGGARHRGGRLPRRDHAHARSAQVRFVTCDERALGEWPRIDRRNPGPDDAQEICA
jgi:hypothetical protein